MRTDVRITQAQADAHYADLLAAVGADPTRRPRRPRWLSRRSERRDPQQLPAPIYPAGQHPVYP